MTKVLKRVGGLTFKPGKKFLKSLEGLSDEEIGLRYEEERARQTELHRVRMNKYQKKLAAKRETDGARLKKIDKIIYNEDGEIELPSTDVVSIDANKLVRMNDEQAKAVVMDTRNDALQIIKMKLKMLSEDEKEMKKMSIAQLATAFGILFDKGQIIRGEATQHIAIHAKVSSEMSSEEMMAQILKMREATQERNNNI